MSRFEEEQKMIKDAANQFPERFGLRHAPGAVFCISLPYSFVSEGQVLLYTCIEKWIAYAKGTVAELRAQVVPLQSTIERTTIAGYKIQVFSRQADKWLDYLDEELESAVLPSYHTAHKRYHNAMKNHARIRMLVCPSGEPQSDSDSWIILS